MSSNRKDCCSIPRYGKKNFKTLSSWSKLFNDACCAHDDLYQRGYTVYQGVTIKASSRRFADEWFYNQMLKIAKDHEHRYGGLGYHAARDMYHAVRKFGYWAWFKQTLKRRRYA